MKIVVLDGSPRKNGNTDIMVEAFKEGALKNNHTVEILKIAAMNIRGCQGCQYCYSHEGQCVFKDDMKGIFEELKDTDMVVFASPIYWFDITAQLKCVIDRMYARGKIGFNFTKTALLLDSGANGVYEAALAQYKAMCSYLKWESVGEICIPNMTQKGSMNTSAMLQNVYELGKSLE